MEYWNVGDITTFPTPYYGFQTVDFVGGHTAYAYGPYLTWLRERGGNAEWLRPGPSTEAPDSPPQTFKMKRMPEELHYNRFIADSAIGAIRQSAKEEKPFFVWCSFPDPHYPIAPPAPYCEMYEPSRMPLPARRRGEAATLPSVYREVLAGRLRPNGVLNRDLSDHQWQEMISLTYGMVTHLDTEIGRVMDALAKAGLADDTIVVFTSDHGDMMGDHGLLWKAFYTFQGCTRVPLIVSVPRVQHRRTCDALVSHVDLLPSILDLCDVAAPGADWVEATTPFERGTVRPLALRPGHSWRGLLDASQTSIRSSVVIENDDPTTGFLVRALVTPSHRLAVFPGTAEGELFDLRADPTELDNLWDKAPALRASLISELLHEYALHTPTYPIPPWNA